MGRTFHFFHSYRASRTHPHTAFFLPPCAASVTGHRGLQCDTADFRQDRGNERVVLNQGEYTMVLCIRLSIILKYSTIPSSALILKQAELIQTLSYSLKPSRCVNLEISARKHRTVKRRYNNGDCWKRELCFGAACSPVGLALSKK